jgi:hypothetical protein
MGPIIAIPGQRGYHLSRNHLISTLAGERRNGTKLRRRQRGETKTLLTRQSEKSRLHYA